MYDFKYVIQRKDNGRVIEYFQKDHLDYAYKWLESYPEFELLEIENVSNIKVQYTELSGPWGYGHQEESFATYGGLLKCVRNLYSWMQETARIFGPDPREVRDYFKNCRLYINGEDKSSWLFKQVEKINLKAIYA